MARLIVVGTKRLTLPLTAVGFQPVAAENAAELAKVFDRLSVDKDVALVVCGESQAVDCPDAVKHFRATGHAVILVVPDGPEPLRLGRAMTREIIEQAAGVDLLGKQEA
jgi:vacuolar-type H+-ATPase subunit F/Vma7